MLLEQAAALSRAEMESGLDMLALLLFRNELKPDTAEAVQSLKAGQVSTCLATPFANNIIFYHVYHLYHFTSTVFMIFDHL